MSSATATNPPSSSSLFSPARPSKKHILARSSRKSSGVPGGIATASTPNLSSLYSAHSLSRLGSLAPSLSRKGSLAAITQNSLASIPDATETYALDSVLVEEPDDLQSEALSRSQPPKSSRKMPPITPAREGAGGGGNLAVGDLVDVPGNMVGTVRFVGTVNGRKGTFAGVELNSEFAARGKNNGDVDGVSYFSTTAPGSGIFLPLAKATRREPLTASGGSVPQTPSSGLKVGTQNSTNYTPPTPSIPKFSQSMGPGRAPSPQGKRPRTSLPRPDSPVRRLQMTPGPRPSITTPATKMPSKYGSPTTTRFTQSVRGTSGDPSKKGIVKQLSRPTLVPRSASAMGQAASNQTDDETTPVGVNRTQTNGSLGSVSSFNSRVRPASRAASRATNHDEEVEKLRSMLEEKDRQLKLQSDTLAEMESSLTEVQALMENPDALIHRRGSMDDKDSATLRALLREKNEKIAMLTAEFDTHRADFRSTIDTLEMASTETERVYEKKMEELMAEIQDLQERTADVDTVASQLKQLEELVQELEEGLEDARRGEAEARGEVEFLRGEVERTRSELRREREKASAALSGGANGVGDRTSTISRDLEQKEDEIRGLKAIIHSLSRDSMPPANADKTPTAQRSSSFRSQGTGGDPIQRRLTHDKLEREVAELRVLLDTKNGREEELEREVEILRRGNAATHRESSMTIGSNKRSSLRDSRSTVVLARDTRSPEMLKHHSRGLTLETMPESDAYSSVTENSTLWCEICETAGHDILTCTNMFGPQDQATPAVEEPSSKATTNGKTGRDAVREGLKPLSPDMHDDEFRPAPLTPSRPRALSPALSPAVKILPNPMESGPVAGKESGVVDASKWCAICERDGHDSVDCPFEDAF